MILLKNIKVIFIDIDRTLTNDNHKIPKLNIEAIKEATQKGILVVLCSGRGLAYAKEKSIEAFASNYIIVFIYTIVILPFISNITAHFN